MNSTLFDLEHLQQLTYERSKKWSSFLEKVTKNETLEEIDLNKLEDNYGPECDENDTDDELVSMEDEECDDVTLDSEVLRNVTNTTRFSLMFNNNATLALPESAKNEEIQLLDIFNQTMPIINEHNRQLKETGLEKVLSTFDKQKIEDKVGSWLNRHNSLYGGDNTIVEEVSRREYKRDGHLLSSTRRKGRNSKNYSPTSKDASHDSDDSLQSGETARYIRSSRAGAIKNSASTTTMIKTYRMVKSTREALREKYACEKIEDEYHVKSLRHRRRIANDLEYHHNHYDLARIQKSRKQELPPIRSSGHKERRKVLRKRNYNNSCSTMDSSSDSDNYYYDEDPRYHRKYLTPCCNQYHYSASHITNHLRTPMSAAVKSKRSQRSTMKMPSARMNRLYYYSNSLSKSLSNSSSSTSFSSTCERRRVVKRNAKLYGDNRPCRRESDCQCCNERKLCEEYKHVADTSTDEWYVENCCSPKKLQNTPVLHTIPSSPTTQLLPVVIEVPNEEHSKMKRNLKSTKNLTKTVEKPKINKTKGNTKSLIQSSADCASVSTVNEETVINTEDEAFNRELQRAIEESKKLYEEEQKTNGKTKDKKEKHELKTKPLRKTSRITNNKQQEEAEGQKKSARKRQTSKKESKTIDSVDDEENEEIVEKLPKLEKEKREESLQAKDISEIFIKPKDLTKELKTSTDTSNVGVEETFFANSQTQTICNSTAVSSKSQAYNRQINDKLTTTEDDNIINKETKKSILKEKSKTAKSRTTPMRKAMSASAIVKKKEATKKVAATSTTIRSPDLHNALSSVTTNKTKSKLTETLLDNEDLSDCTLVTSTTNIEPTTPSNPSVSTTLIHKTLDQQQQQEQNSTADSVQQNSHKGIVIYAPDQRSMAPAHSFTSDGYFTITKEHLSSIIGEKPAEKFLKYYIGRKRFNSNSTVYFKPPSSRNLDGNSISSSSDSDDDLDSLGQYGDLYESLNKTS